jgi:hypothetical protein
VTFAQVGFTKGGIFSISETRQLQPQMIARRIGQILLNPKVTLGGLDRSMAQGKLNLKTLPDVNSAAREVIDAINAQAVAFVERSVEDVQEGI